MKSEFQNGLSEKKSALCLRVNTSRSAIAERSCCRVD